MSRILQELQHVNSNIDTMNYDDNMIAFYSHSQYG